MRNRKLVRLAATAAALAGVVTMGSEALALSLNSITASWPEGLVRFQSGFVPATTFTPGSSAAGTQIIWFGPGQNTAEGAALNYKRPTLPVPIPLDASNRSAPFVIGSVQYRNFPTTTKGPIELVLDLDLGLSDPTVSPTIQIPFEINHTNDNVLDLSACPAGSSTKCDDVLSLLGGAPLDVATLPGGLTLRILGFDGAPSDPEVNDPVLTFLGPEGTIGAQTDIIARVVPEPATIALLGLALVGVGAWRRRTLRLSSDNL